MTNERNNPGNDPLVSDTYHELANERTPDALNDQVLRIAARDARTRYSIARAWMRPVAWVATIGLSLALVMELSELPQPEFEVLSEPPAKVAPASTPVEEGLLETKAGYERQRKQAPAAAKRREPAVQKVSRADDSSMEVFEPRDMAVMQEAEELARAQAGSDQPQAVIADVADQQIAVVDEIPNRQPALDSAVANGQKAVENNTTDELAAANMATAPAFAASAAIAMTANTSESLADDLCPDKARETAEKWFECIEDAAEKGAPPALVDKEYEQLREKFPEFEAPAPNR